MPDSQQEHEIYTHNEWTQNLYFQTIVKFLAEQKIKSYIDLGANVGGVYDVLQNQISTLKEAYLFEPEPRNFMFLAHKYIIDNKVKLYPSAIYYGQNNNLYSCDNSVGGYSLVPHDNSNRKFRPTVCNIRITPLEFFNLSVDFIKIDIEASEYNVIAHSQTIKTTKYLDIEFHIGNPFSVHTNEDPSIEDNLKYVQTYLPNHVVIFQCHNHLFLELKS